MTPAVAAIWSLGAVQCVYWGVLYYSFAVLLVPMRAEFGVDHSTLAGAYSLGLAVSAALAAMVGRRLDRGHGALLLRVGSLGSAVLLWAWSQVTSVTALYSVWIGLGAGMALVLYETAFALVTRAVADPAQRLRALARVTVLGGLASTVFLPLAGLGVELFGWRTTLQALVVIWLLATWLLERRVLPAFDGRATAPAAVGSDPQSPLSRSALLRLAAPFVAGTFSALAVTTLVVTLLVERGHPLALAAGVLAGFGLMQLPGRIGLWLGGGTLHSPRGLLVLPLLLQAAGLLLLATPTLTAALLGVALFGLGIGLHTLARPWVVPLLVGARAAGRVNGAIARSQGFARAAGPFAAAAAYGTLGATPLFVGLALLLLSLSPLAATLARGLPGSN